MHIEFHRVFKKLYKKQPQSVQKKFDGQLELFLINPFDERLHNHALSGDLKKYRSIDVTGNIRVWYEIYDDTIIFMKIGTHSELYG